jgi:hypothetical protein
MDVRLRDDWVAHASRVLVPIRLGLSASRRNNLFFYFRRQ